LDRMASLVPFLLSGRIPQQRQRDYDCCSNSNANECSSLHDAIPPSPSMVVLPDMLVQVGVFYAVLNGKTMGL